MSDNLPAKTDHDAIDDAKRISELGPFKVLLNRSFKAIGDFVGEGVEDYIKQYKNRQEENLKSHIDAVQGAATGSEKSIRQQQLVFQWADKAQDVGSDEPVLASFWRVALEAIERGNLLAEDAVKVVAELTSSDAAALLRVRSNGAILRSLFSGVAPITHLQKKKLTSLGLLHRWQDALPLGPFAILIACYLMAGIFTWLPFDQTFQVSRNFRVGFLSVTPMIVLGFALFIVTRMRLTPLGEYICRGSRKYRVDLGRHAEPASTESAPVS